MTVQGYGLVGDVHRTGYSASSEAGFRAFVNERATGLGAWSRAYAIAKAVSSGLARSGSIVKIDVFSTLSRIAASAVGRPVEVQAYTDRIVIRQDGRIVANAGL